MALLHKGMLEKKKLMISGHSQGSMLTSSAILAFYTISDEHKRYLKSSVKVFHMEPEVLKPIRGRIRELLNDVKTVNKKYLVYIMNDSDFPLRSDILTNISAQEFPLAPPGTITISEEVEVIKNLFNDMQQNINSQNILSIGTTIFGNAKLNNIFSRYVSNDFSFNPGNIDAHGISNQLNIIAADMLGNKFRSDPSEEANGPLSRTTNSPNHQTAVDVKKFIIT